MGTTSSLDELANRTMGGCKLIRRIGKGAMGVVYLANQIDLGREVAFKILDPKFSADKSYIERFEMEARAAAQLNHPNIVKVFDFGSENGLFYIVNEYINGGTVQNLIEEKTASIRRRRSSTPCRWRKACGPRATPTSSTATSSPTTSCSPGKARSKSPTSALPKA